MNWNLLLENITNPALLFFFLGILAVKFKSDLEIPGPSAKFISLYLLISIGFKGGQELAHSHFDLEILWSVLFGVFLALAIPLYSFLILKKKLGVFNAGAIAAAYGSVSAITFVTAISFLEHKQLTFGGHMVAIMAIMEVPAIVIGVFLVGIFTKKENSKIDIKGILKHSITNASVLLILGSLVIGYLASEEQARDIKPFTTELFKGFLAIFLLDMGIKSGKKLGNFSSYGWFPILFAIIFPLINGCLAGIISGFFTNNIGNQLMFATLAASASYIAVPASVRLAIPKADEGLYIPMALAITFPINITIGLPLYFELIKFFN